MSDQLRSLGIELIEGFGAEQMALQPDMFVVGNVISRTRNSDASPKFPLMEAILDAGAPYTSGPQWLAEHVLQGRHVLAVAGTHGKTTTTGMISQILVDAGKNPTVIFADCNFDKMLKTVLRSSFENQGQICLCGSRILVERPIYEKFKLAFVEKVKALTVGDPNDEVNLGAIVSKNHFEKILSYIELAKQEGGTILAGGNALKPNGRCENGYFIAPTIIEGLSINCRTNMEEIFGPVVSIMPFDTDEEVIAYANTSEYGLACSIWTENLTKAHQMADAIQCGIIWVNCWLLRDLRTPFGGMKSSGVGREGGWEALRFFTEPKNICIKY